MKKKDEELLGDFRESKAQVIDLQRELEEAQYEEGRKKQEVKFLKERIERLSDPQISKSEKDQQVWAHKKRIGELEQLIEEMHS